jgi:hypothetical protein
VSARIAARRAAVKKNDMSTHYKILGSDGQEYGPVQLEQVKQWIADRRVERKSRVLAEGTADWTVLENVPEIAALFTPAAPPVLPDTSLPPKSDGGLNVIIPYKNVRALVAYYLGVFSAIPILGMPLGLAAFTLGILALRFRRQNPAAGGVVHAWIGILAGGFFGLVYLALIILGIGAIISHRTNH